MASRAAGSPPPVPWEITWTALQAQGWTADTSQAKTMYFPPNVTRENGKKRVNYFDSQKQVRDYIANLQSAMSPPSAAAVVARPKRPRSAERLNKSPPVAQASPRKQLDLRKLKVGHTMNFPRNVTGRWGGGEATVLSITADKIVVARCQRDTMKDKGLEEISRHSDILWPTESSPVGVDQTVAAPLAEPESPAEPAAATQPESLAEPAAADLAADDGGDRGGSDDGEGELARTYLIRTIPPPQSNGAAASSDACDVYVPKKQYDQTLRLQVRFGGASESSTVDRTKDELGTVAAIATEHLEHMCFPHTELVAPTMLRWAFSKVRPVLRTAVITIFVDSALLASCDVCRRPREAVALRW